jgi:hypothetical protein
MAVKSLDSQVLTNSVMETMQETLSKIGGIVPSSDPETKEVEIEEYEGRMKVTGFGKFESVSFISAINLYLNQADMDRHKPKGAVILYLDSENASKFFKGLDVTVDEDEDDSSMMNGCGEFCKIIAEGFKNKLKEKGYPELLLSEPSNFKNSALRGVEFSADQKTKYEFSFFYWKHKALIVDVTLSDLPRK